jgi:hypothetical protein
MQREIRTTLYRFRSRLRADRESFNLDAEEEGKAMTLYELEKRIRSLISFQKLGPVEATMLRDKVHKLVLDYHEDLKVGTKQ